MTADADKIRSIFGGDVESYPPEHRSGGHEEAWLQQVVAARLALSGQDMIAAGWR